MPDDTMGGAGWYDTRWGRLLYWGVLVATLVGVVASATVTGLRMQVPLVAYLFGFLGATVYVFTSFAKRFGEAGRYRLKILSRTVAVLPLAAGVYLLAMAFPGIEGGLSAMSDPGGNGGVSETDRLVAGLVFLAGIYVSATLKALGGLAERMLGVGPSQQDGEPEGDESGSESTATETDASGESTEESDSSETETDTQSDTEIDTRSDETETDTQSGDTESADTQSDDER